MGLRAVALALALAAALLLLPSTAAAAEPARVLVAAGFALNPEQPSIGFRLHPRIGFPVWRSTHPGEGTLELGLFGGWSHRPIAFRAAMFGDTVTATGAGAHHALALASVGHGAHALTPEGHLFQFDLHLLGGWAYRSDEARVDDDRYGVDSSWSEAVQGPVVGTLSRVGLLFDGVGGPVFEASWLYGTSRGLACWHLGIGVAIRIGPEVAGP